MRHRDLILGINKGSTLRNKPLRLGGVAVAVDGEIKLAISEERVTGKKWAGGYESALRQTTRSLSEMLKRHVELADFSAVAVSSCCEGEEAGKRGHPLESHPGLCTANHHVSHASVAFFPSGLESALICVIDGGGNTFGDDSPQRWWECDREQHSYYIGSRSLIELVDRDFFKAGETGFGEIYRAFTFYLGWPSSRHAAKLMALAAYGEGKKVSVKSFVDFADGKLSIPVLNNPESPVKMVQELGRNLGIDFGEPRAPNAEILPIHKNIAAYVQQNLETALLERLRWLSHKYGIRSLCLGGGFALNCVINGALARTGVFDKVYVPSTPGDEGQAIGNALFCSHRRKKENSFVFPSFRYSKDVQLGPTYEIHSDDIMVLFGSVG